MENFELVFMPGPGMGHLASTVEMANILVARDRRLSITILAIGLLYDAKAREEIESLSISFARKSIHFTVLPQPLELSLPQVSNKTLILKAVVESYRPNVREAVATLVDAPRGPRLVGFVIDMFYTTMIDVAKEFEVPCYVLYTSGAGFLDLSFQLQELYHKNNSNEAVEQLQNSDAELVLPSFVNSIPGKVIPDVFFEKEASIWFHENSKRLRLETKGILINTFVEMESNILNKMSSQDFPPIYPIGPVLHLKNTNSTLGLSILKWLDDQPPSSVVFLCFGSMGSFKDDQVKEIARALERTGVRFLWSLRQPPPQGKLGAPSDYANIEDVLPEGFLERTASVGKVIGWAPQVEILAHQATGGFVSHCGWNSTLESLWHGVPMATWPMYAEQQLNAFELVVELGLATEITMDYRKDSHGERSRIISAEVIESGLKKLMDDGNEMRKKVRTMKEESRKSVMEGGSSFISLGHFIDEVLSSSCKNLTLLHAL